MSFGWNPFRTPRGSYGIWFGSGSRARRNRFPFFPNPAGTYAQKCGGTPAQDPPARLCGTAWEDRYRERGDAYDPAVRTAFRGLDPLDGRFAEIACGVFGPLVKEAKEN